MAIAKFANIAFGISSLRLQYEGPEQQITVAMTLTPARTIGHDDPASAPSARRFFSTLLAPASPTVRELVLGREQLPLGVFSTPAFAYGTYDVNVAVGNPFKSGESFSSWYSRRHDDDWDDDVFRFVEG